MRSRSLLALAPLILVVELALAQTCPCTQQTDATCEVLELSGPGTCSSSAFTCNKCLCVTEGSGTSTCDVESAQALVFTGSGSECALQSVSYAKCPEVAAVGWTAAADNGQHCDRACTAVNGTCNVDRLIALNDLGGVDNTAFAAVFSEVGLTCRFFVDDPNLGAPLYYSGGCGYSSSKTPVCGAALAYGSSVRVCCCGADEDCPVATLTPTPTPTPTPTATPTPTPTPESSPGWTATAGNGQHCDTACTAVRSTCNVDRLIALNDLGGVDNTAFAAVFSEVGLTCRFFVDDPNLGAPLYYSGGCGYSSSKTPVCGAALAYGSSVRVCCCGADEDCPI